MGTLPLKERSTQTEKRELRAKREQGVVPGVLYGKTQESTNVFINVQNLGKITRADGVLFKVSLGGQTHQVNLGTVQKDPGSGKVLHVELHKLEENAQVTVEIPITITGKAIGQTKGGILQQVAEKIRVKGATNNIPETITLDVSGLEFNSKMTYGDLTVPSGVEVVTNDPEGVLVTCNPPKVQQIDTPLTQETTTETKEGAETTPELTQDKKAA